MNNKPIWTIMICTMSKRAHFLGDLLKALEPQLNNMVTIIHDDREGISIGAKRNHLVNSCATTYSSFIDDDDMISPNYVAKHLELLKSNPDGIGFYGIYTIDGRSPSKFIHSAKFGAWSEKSMGQTKEYYRTLNHWNVLKNEFRIKAPFPDISFGEDHQQSNDMHPLINAKNCYDITDEPMYFYNFRNGISVTSIR